MLVNIINRLLIKLQLLDMISSLLNRVNLGNSKTSYVNFLNKKNWSIANAWRRSIAIVSKNWYDDPLQTQEGVTVTGA